MRESVRRYMANKRRGGGYREYDRGQDYGYEDESDYGHGEFEGEYRGEYETDNRAWGGGQYGRRREYGENDYDTPDGRRGVKYTGQYGIGGRKHYPRRDRAMREPEHDYGDVRLTKKDMRDWKENLENADGSEGAHFDLAQIEQAAQSIGIQMMGYDVKELCLAANMLYSDYCSALSIPKDREAMVYTKMGRAFLDDPDSAVKGGEKLAAYYYAIVCDEEG